MTEHEAMHQEDDATIPDGCQSAAHDHADCWGDLWQCAGCGNSVCYEDGSDNDPELCDECWNKKHGED